jgi:hypothetical protein
MGRVHGVVEKNPMGWEAIFRGDQLRCKVFQRYQKRKPFLKQEMAIVPQILPLSAAYQV